MLTSELIAQLTALVAEHGDRRLVFVSKYDPDTHSDPDMAIALKHPEDQPTCGEDCVVVWHR